MPSLVSYASVALGTLSGLAAAVKGGSSGQMPFTYTAGQRNSTLGGSTPISFSSVTYEYTGLGAAESTINFLSNGDWAYSPALSKAGVGYATSSNKGKTWTQVLPGGSAQQRPQPYLSKKDGVLYFWSTQVPGLYFSRSTDDGATWKAVNGTNFDQDIQDWAKLVSGPPKRSRLSNGAKEILYISGPSLISTPIPIQPIGPIEQVILKSTDRGVTWTKCLGKPTLQPSKSGGACAGASDQELIIWGDGFVKSDGTIMFGLRRCQALSIAISDDEGDSWRLVDVPGSDLPAFSSDPISVDAAGNIYAVWVDKDYVLKLSKSFDNAKTWTTPVNIGAPGFLANSKTYLPKLRHSTTPGKAALVYYGSTDNFATWDGYIAESTSLLSTNPVFRTVIGNPRNQKLQANQAKAWDSGYLDFSWDLIEFSDVRYEDSTGDLVAALTRRMCTAPTVPHDLYDMSSCVEGWNYVDQAKSAWQGVVMTVKH